MGILVKILTEFDKYKKTLRYAFDEHSTFAVQWVQGVCIVLVHA